MLGVVTASAIPLGAQETDAPTPDAPAATRTEALAAALGGWSPQLEVEFGVLTQSHDGEATVPTNADSSVLRNSGDAITSGFAGFGLAALSPVILESSLRPRLVLRSTLQIPVSDGLISNKFDASFDRGAPGFPENCPDPVPGSNIPTATCSFELRNRTKVNMLWTAGLGLDLLLPTEARTFHLQPAVEYIAMKAQPEGSFKRTTTGDDPPRFVEFIKQVGASEIFHGVATSLTASADAYREGPWVWSFFLNGRAAWFLTDREIATRKTTADGEFIFVTEPAVNDANEVQWQAMFGISVRLDPLAE